MGWLPDIFSRFTRKGDGASSPASPLPSPSMAVPVPTGEWRIIVDRQGRRVTDREPQPGDMLARPPVSYKYGGTLPGFVPDLGKSDAQNLAARMDYEIRAVRNRDLLDQAVFLLSQTPDGRRLLYLADREKFTFVFDPQSTAEQNAAGLCDYANKQIPLAEGYTAEQVALTLKHELQHMEDITCGAGRYGSDDTLASATIANRGLEANARVSEAVFAMESLTGDPQGPDTRFRTYGIMARFHDKNPQMGAAALNSRDLIGAGDQAGWAAFGNRVFRSYYESTQTLAYYDERLAKLYAGHNDLRTADELRADAANSNYYRGRPDRLEALFTSLRQERANILTTPRATSEDLRRTLMLRGQPYLEFDGKFNPESEQARGITAMGMKAFDRLKARFESLGIKPGPEGALDNIPRHNEAPPPKPLGREFAEALAVRPQPEFRPFVLPNRFDGPQGTDGIREHARTASIFMSYYNKPSVSNAELDKFDFAISDWVHNCGTMNIYGRVGALLKAGLRAPINVFPDDYLLDLAQRLRYGGKSGSGPGENNFLQVSDHERDLIEHWRQMAQRGMSPVWGEESHRKASMYGDGPEKLYIADYILPAIGYDPAAPLPAGTAPISFRRSAL